MAVVGALAIVSSERQQLHDPGDSSMPIATCAEIIILHKAVACKSYSITSDQQEIDSELC